MSNILITICARGGSKGIPGKNIKPVNGRPLLWYTASVAKKVSEKYSADIIVSTDSEGIVAKKVSEKYSADIIVSTDSEGIKKVASDCGIPTDYTRPDYLANDTSGKPDAIKDALLYAENKYHKKYDFIVDLDVTSPIRTLEDIEACINRISDCEDALTIFSVNPCARNPYFNMVQEKENGFYGVVLGGIYKTRQSAPKVYDMNASIYVYRREALDCENPKAVTERSLIHVMDHICFDLDEPSDYDYLAYLLETGKISI